FDDTTDDLRLESESDGERLSIVNIEGIPHLRYQPLPGFVGRDEFGYLIVGESSVVDGRVQVDVTNINDAPIAVDDRYETAEDTTFVFDPRFNDVDPDGEELTVISVGSPQHGTIETNQDGLLTYTADADFFGDDLFSYTVEDAEGLQSTATINVEVIPTFDPVIAVDDLVFTQQDSPVDIDVLANDLDPDNQLTAPDLVSLPSFGSIEIVSETQFRYTPEESFFGADEFTYSIRDAEGNPSTATVTIQVDTTEPNAIADVVSLVEDNSAVFDVLSNDLNIDRSDITLEIVLPPDSGELVINDLNEFQYTPDPDFSGEDSFTYRVFNSAGLDSEARVVLTVANENDAPVAEDDEISLDEDETVIIDVLENDFDADGDTLSVSIEKQPNSGELVRNDDETLTYVPLPDFFGTDEFSYTITDAAGETAAAVVRLEIFSDSQVENVAPVITSLSNSATLPAASTNGNVTIMGSFEDADFNDTHAVTVDWGDGLVESVTPSDSGFSASHEFAQGGLYDITVTVTDSVGNSVIRMTRAAVQGARLHQGVFQLIGTDGFDRIVIQPANDGNDLEAAFRTEFGDEMTVVFAANEVQAVEIITRDGDDSIHVSSDLAIPTSIDSGLGDDIIYGGSGPATIRAGAGNDKIFAGPAADQIFAGDGNDLIMTGDGLNEAFGGEGDDLIFGGKDADQLHGEGGQDSIRGDNGDDRLDGGEGDDNVSGDEGEDTIDGGGGNDRLLGGNGSDMIRGSAGNDLIIGGVGDDTLLGGLGNDQIDGQTGDDEIFGGDGNDQLFGRRDSDRLDGGDGDDYLSGGFGTDTLLGGIGVDDFEFDPNGDLPTDPEPTPPQPTTRSELLIDHDVNGDGRVSPLDALIIINQLVFRRAAESQTDVDSATYDINQDGEITPMDALSVINRLVQGREDGDGNKSVKTELQSAFHDELNDVFQVQATRVANFADNLSAALLRDLDDPDDERLDQWFADLERTLGLGEQP
ncbi:MAG: Ig-like domain-containing protein, partial [Planctomycetota bacterium]